MTVAEHNNQLGLHCITQFPLDFHEILHRRLEPEK